MSDTIEDMINRLTERQRHEFALACARRVQHLMTDPRSTDALDTRERWLRGSASEEEMDAAWRAATIAVWHAEKDEARAATIAVWHAEKDEARAAACGAARPAARAAAWAAAEAQYAAQYAARAAARAAACGAARPAARAAAWAVSGAVTWDAKWTAERAWQRAELERMLGEGGGA